VKSEHPTYQLDEYQRDAGHVSTWAPGGSKPLAYYALKLNGEAGEVAELVGKVWRGDFGPFEHDPAEGFRQNPELKAKLVKELGDVLWYVQHIAARLDVPLSEVALANITKLQARVDNVRAGLPAKSGQGA
jgi:NTP pyrophosphatase (non-canonical NTP hydrolase)